MTKIDEEIDLGDAPLSSEQSRAARYWLKLGVLSLAIAGLFAILLVLSRTPGLETFFPWYDFFRTALVIHVDQSVLIWFLSMAGMGWSLFNYSEKRSALPGRIAFALCLLGALVMASSAFMGSGAPLMNNYVPVLQRPWFFIALGLFGSGVLLQLSLALSSLPWRAFFVGRLSMAQLVMATVAIATAMSLLALAWAWVAIPYSLDGEAYYEYLFWGAGHTLQFAYTQLMLLGWILLAVASGVTILLRARPLNLLLLLGVVPVLVVPVIYLAYPTLSGEWRHAFTRLMIYAGGIAAIPIGLTILWGLLKVTKTEGEKRVLRLTLWMSLLLFFAGGGIGVSITGVNTVIPAHYHGSIVGVTLALMGLAYLVLPRLGYGAVRGRLAVAQPLLYGGGQLLHIIGLTISGLLGVQRKTAGAAQGLDSLSSKLAMGVMGVGGLLAVLGGVLFVWIMLKAFFSKGRG